MLAALVASPWTATTLIVSVAVAHPDAVVSLASHEWERLPTAARLAIDHLDAQVILTEPRPVTPFNCHDCSHRVERLEMMGVAAARVTVLPLSHSGTFGEALAVRDFASAKRLRHLVIVTSPYHTRRALATFRDVLESDGIEVGVEPASEFSPARPTSWVLWGYDRAYVSYEWAGIVYYLWHYGVKWSDLRVDAGDAPHGCSGRMVASLVGGPGDELT